MGKHLALFALIATLAVAPALAVETPQHAPISLEPHPHGVAMADGGTATLLSDGKVSELINGKRFVLGPGSYKLQTGQSLKIEATGVVSAASRAMLNPQPLPP